MYQSVHLRETFYSANNMKERFQKTEMNNVKRCIYTEKSKEIFNKIKFLQQTVYYKKKFNKI